MTWISSSGNAKFGRRGNRHASRFASTHTSRVRRRTRRKSTGRRKNLLDDQFTGHDRRSEKPAFSHALHRHLAPGRHTPLNDALVPVTPPVAAIKIVIYANALDAV